MVGYDDANNALTLGDDDSLQVGEYELQYSSGNDRFEILHPNGQVSHIPRSTSSSLVPKGLSETVSAGEALADDGNRYSSIQTALNNAAGWVFVGPGTFNESVEISTTGMTLVGSGVDTVIDGGTSGDAVAVNFVQDCTVKNLQAKTTAGQLTGYHGIVIRGGSGHRITGCLVSESDATGIRVLDSQSPTIRQCSISNVDRGIYGGTITVTSCEIGSTNNDHGIFLEDTARSAIISNNVIRNTQEDGIRVLGSDCIVSGNRVRSSGFNGIGITGTENIISNNRVSDSANTNILDDGTETVLDDNKSGSRN